MQNTHKRNHIKELQTQLLAPNYCRTADPAAHMAGFLSHEYSPGVVRSSLYTSTRLDPLYATAVNRAGMRTDDSAGLLAKYVRGFQASGDSTGHQTSGAGDLSRMVPASPALDAHVRSLHFRRGR